MALIVLHINSSLPISYPVDPTAEFEPGVLGQLKTIGNDIVIGVSDGTAPFGIIDDVRTQAFTKAQVDEIVVVSVDLSETDSNGKLVSSADEVGFLDNPHILESSFISTISVELNHVNGAITIPAGTELNYDADGDGVNDSIKVVVNYIYRVANRPGDDSTLGTGKVTVHYSRGIYATDQFDTRQLYPLNATLYCGLDGKLTTKQPSANHPGVAFVSGPPSSANATLEFVWL
jgi:hypothetical protein